MIARSAQSNGKRKQASLNGRASRHRRRRREGWRAASERQETANQRPANDAVTTEAGQMWSGCTRRSGQARRGTKRCAAIQAGSVCSPNTSRPMRTRKRPAMHDEHEKTKRRMVVRLALPPAGRGAALSPAQQRLSGSTSQTGRAALRSRATPAWSSPGTGDSIPWTRPGALPLGTPLGTSQVPRPLQVLRRLSHLALPSVP